MTPEQLGQTLRTRHKQAMITQRDPASLSGLAVHTLSDLESGLWNPTLEVLWRVCAVLGLEIRLSLAGVAGSPSALTLRAGATE